ncbi:hypothetical protein BST61_g5288 [Cercospora zeina]
MASPVERESHPASGQSTWPERFAKSPLEDTNAGDVFRRADQTRAIDSRQGEFITFPDRKDSQQSYLSGSSGNRSDSTRVSRFLQPSMSPLTPDTLSAWS